MILGSKRQKIRQAWEDWNLMHPLDSKKARRQRAKRDRRENKRVVREARNDDTV